MPSLNRPVGLQQRCPNRQHMPWYGIVKMFSGWRRLMRDKICGSTLIQKYCLPRVALSGSKTGRNGSKLALGP